MSRGAVKLVTDAVPFLGQVFQGLVPVSLRFLRGELFVNPALQDLGLCPQQQMSSQRELHELSLLPAWYGTRILAADFASEK